MDDDALTTLTESRGEAQNAEPGPERPAAEGGMSGKQCSSG